ncbi:MAG: class I SAM-dependent methyltransferase [Planctomycetia bacterium]|nr:class I SAM-dependent methyltransferase [Planctomycetia bacterium]
MFKSQEYEMLDFGAGRRLERLSELILDRPCPSAEGIRRAMPRLWEHADAKFIQNKNVTSKNNAASLGVRGYWTPLTEVGAKYFDLPSKNSNAPQQSSRSWFLPYGERFTFELKGSAFGHVGVFPEQASNWDRIMRLCEEAQNVTNASPVILNLFGYTGGSTLAAASTGAQVTHVDAARNIVAQARRNAESSFQNQMGEAREGVGAIRWIADDAVKYVKREQKRGSVYNGIILDPPSYGHGARGEVWRLSRDLEPLLQRCVDLLATDFAFIMLTCHTPQFEYQRLASIVTHLLRNRFGYDIRLETEAHAMEITSRNGARLHAGDLALIVLRNP